MPLPASGGGACASFPSRSPPRACWAAARCSCCLLALLLEHPWRISPTPTSLAALAALGALSTAVAYLLYFRLLRRVGPTNLALVTFLLPIVALALGAVFLGEHIEIGDLAGLALILFGLAAIDGRIFRPRQGHITCGGRDIRIASGFPPVLRPKTVPRS